MQLFWLALFPALVVAKPNAATHALGAHLQQQGYLSAKVLIQDDGLVVAQEAIAKGEHVLNMPMEFMLDESKLCQTVLDVVHLYLNSSSDQTNDLRTLFAKHLIEADRKPIILWSEPAQEILRGIVGHELDPVDWSGLLFSSTCTKWLESQDSLPETSLLERAAAILESTIYWIPGYGLFPHRRGPYHNIEDVSSSNDDDTESFFTLAASTNIAAGESIFVSWSECHIENKADADCPSTSEIFSQAGFVEEGATQWIWGMVEYDIDDKESVSFNKDGKEFLLFHTSFLLSHYERLEIMEPEFREQWEALEDAQEADLLAKYYKQLKRGFLLASKEARISSDDDKEHIQECDLDMDGNISPPSCSSIRRYDDLDELKPSADVALEELCAHGTFSMAYDYSLAEDSTSSFYQSIRFAQAQNPRTKHPDTCLILEDILQSCTSYRPYYHEFMLHYPISFLKPNQLKRVLVLGGGDIMFVHEIIKYESLEMLVMLELDQQVPRQAFRNYGIQPGFDNPKVNWWFGDASKTLQMIPEEWYGTFDLVLVDLLTYVVDTVYVSETENLLDAAKRLMHPDGIIVRNEDFDYVKDPSFAKTVVLFQVDDVPVQCHQFNTMGSNSIEFLKHDTFDHRVDTLLYEHEKDHHYRSWRNYYRQNDEDSKAIVDEKEEIPSETGGMDEVSSRHGGLMIVLEVEQSSANLTDSSLVASRIREAIESSGLAIRESLPLSIEANNDKKSSVIMVGEQGYVEARVWPSLAYCAFDVVLWREFGIQDQLVKSLVDAVGGRMENGALTSYRVATGIGLKEAKSANQKTDKTERTESAEESQKVASITDNTFEHILRSLVSSLSARSHPLLVLCGDKEIASCSSLVALDKASEVVYPLWQCSDSHATMQACEERALQMMTDFVETNRSFGGIIVDASVSREMGQIVHRIFSDTPTRDTLLAEELFALSILPNQHSQTTDWINVLLNRFRTDMIIFEPCFNVNISVPFDGSKIHIFSAGTRDLYSKVKQSIVDIEEETGLELSFDGGLAGNSKYQANFEPTESMLMEDYDLEPSFSQWKGQRPMGLQTNWQFEVRPPPTPLEKGDRVLISISSGHWFGEWTIGTIQSVLENDRYSVLADGAQHPTTKSRDKLLEFKSPQPGQHIKPGEIVVAPYQGLYELDRDTEAQARDESDLRGTWDQGFVLETGADGSYKIQIFWDGKDVWVKPEHIGFRYPPQPEQGQVDLTKTQLRDILERGIQAQGSRINGSLDQLSVGMTDLGSTSGCVFTAIWTLGSLVATWDGDKRIDVDLFLEGDAASEGRRSQSSEWEAFLTKEIPHLAVSTMTKQPRGYGQVVNTQAELEKHWFGLDQQMQEYDDDDDDDDEY